MLSWQRFALIHHFKFVHLFDYCCTRFECIRVCSVKCPWKSFLSRPILNTHSSGAQDPSGNKSYLFINEGDAYPGPGNQTHSYVTVIDTSTAEVRPARVLSWTNCACYSKIDVPITSSDGSFQSCPNSNIVQEVFLSHAFPVLRSCCVSLPIDHREQLHDTLLPHNIAYMRLVLILR